MLNQQVKLSLETFQPEKCYPPYLNTPRSLEACRINGINPVELVVIPYSEFQRDFPNDPDATHRRYERIEGARKRILKQVTDDWKKLVETGWKPPEAKPPPKSETILPVSPNAHCQLLEIQAAKFRKMEQDNWESLNRNLRIQILKADQEVRGQQIVAKQNDIQEQNEKLKKERKMALEELERENLQRQREEEEYRQQEIKREQIEFAENELRKHEQRIREREEAKKYNQKREEERVNSEAYTRQTRNAIMNRLEHRFSDRKKACEIKQVQTDERLNQFFDMRDKTLAGKRNAVDQKLQSVRNERMRREEESRQEMLASIQEAEKKRQQVEAERERLQQQRKKSSDNDTAEKVQRMREMSDSQTQEKIDRTMHLLQYKDDLAKQELEKMKEAQERRRRIKAIRREAYEISKFRADRAEEYRKQRLEQEIKDKEERSAAIRRGFHILEHMRNSMKDIMVKTNLELKDEFHRLRHTGRFSPDKVVATALDVSNHVLFPSLQHTFGIQDLAQEEAQRQEQNKRFFQTDYDSNDDDNNDAFKFNSFQNNDNDGTNNNLDGNNNNNSATMPLFEGDRTMPRAKTTMSSGKRPVSPNKATSQREEVATLPIQLLTKDRLKSTLMESMKRVEKMRLQDESMRSSRNQSKHGSPSGTSRRHNDYDSDDDEHHDNDSRNGAILRLHQVEHATNRPDAQMIFGGHSSPTSHHHPQSSSRHNRPASDGFSLTSSQQQQNMKRSLSEQNAANGHSHALLSSSMTLSSAHASTSASPEAQPSKNSRLQQSRHGKMGQTKSSPHHKNNNNNNVDSTNSVVSNGRADDVQLPTIELTTGKEFHDMQQQKELEESAGKERGRNNHRSRPRSANNASMTSAERKKESLRTDVNKKAKYMPIPRGKFRKEFSLDHPLAPKGKGKYSTELGQGLQPMNTDMPKDPKASNVQETLQLAEKVEKLTYDAQQKVVDSDEGIKKMQDEMARKLGTVIEEERIAEEARSDALRNLPPGDERSKVEQIFAEERARASERIITATKEHDQAVRRALLRTMNLGN